MLVTPVYLLKKGPSQCLWHNSNVNLNNKGLTLNIAIIFNVNPLLFYLKCGSLYYIVIKKNNGWAKLY